MAKCLPRRRLSQCRRFASGCARGSVTTCMPKHSRAQAIPVRFSSAGSITPSIPIRCSISRASICNLRREFPADGAAGEGFTNTGNALVMSPALLAKYLDAGKKIADHAVLLPDGIRFSPGATRRDWTDEVLARIRGFYGRFTDAGGGTKVNLQGLVFGTNDGGRLPLEKYLRATIREREALATGTKSIVAVARQQNLNAKYLSTLWSTLHAGDPLPVLDGMRARWQTAHADQASEVSSEIARWQKSLWRFTSVGHIGKVGGPKAWMEPVTPIAARQDLRMKMPATAGGDVSIYLVAGDAGDGNGHDFVVWEQPRLVAPGRPDLLLRDVRDVAPSLLPCATRLWLGRPLFGRGG